MRRCGRIAVVELCGAGRVKVWGLNKPLFGLQLFCIEQSLFPYSPFGLPALLAECSKVTVGSLTPRNLGVRGNLNHKRRVVVEEPCEHVVSRGNHHLATNVASLAAYPPGVPSLLGWVVEENDLSVFTTNHLLTAQLESGRPQVIEIEWV